MIDLLNLKEGLSYLEPSAGDGVFVSAISSKVSDYKVDAFDLNPASIKSLREAFYVDPKVNIENRDTLLDENLAFAAGFGGSYDRIIANPPYGAWQDYSKRKVLKKQFPNLYVKETYALFLYRCIQLLRPKGYLVFIIPDTFLNLHMHTALRQFLLKRTKIISLDLFPSSFFPGVAFGYANLCIICLQREDEEKKCLENTIKINSGFNIPDDLNGNDHQIKYLKQEEVLKNIDSAFFITESSIISKIISNCDTRVSDIAKCVTGFYSGNDKEYLHPLSMSVRGAKRYQAVNQSKVVSTNIIPLDGLRGSQTFIPIVKGGKKQYIKPTEWYMDWSTEAVQHYKTDKKARFQNSQYYFRDGIAVPMVSSSRITAALIENRLFDQSIVGIFPYNQQHLFFLLGFFNTKICNQLIRTINPSANNSAKYIGKIPIPKIHPSFLSEVNTLVQKILTEIKATGEIPDNLQEKLELIFKREIYNLST